MNIVDKAIELALTWHFGVANKHDGEPYVLHLNRVASAVRQRGGSEEAQAMAWLHDILEDTPCTPQDLQAGGMNDRIIFGVMMLTKTKNGENFAYYIRIRDCGDAEVVLVKNCDIDDNFSRNHMIEDETKRLRMAGKYSMGKYVLK